MPCRTLGATRRPQKSWPFVPSIFDCCTCVPGVLPLLQFLLVWVELILDPESVGESAGVSIDARLELGDAAAEIVRCGVAVVVGHVLAQPAPERLDRHEIGAVSRP